MFTINLTRGAYVVRQADADKILRAVEQNEPHILVEADLLGDGLYYSPVRIIVQHVIAVVKNKKSDAIDRKPRLALVSDDRFN